MGYSQVGSDMIGAEDEAKKDGDDVVDGEPE